MEYQATKIYWNEMKIFSKAIQTQFLETPRLSSEIPIPSLEIEILSMEMRTNSQETVMKLVVIKILENVTKMASPETEMPLKKMPTQLLVTITVSEEMQTLPKATIMESQEIETLWMEIKTPHKDL